MRTRSKFSIFLVPGMSTLPPLDGKAEKVFVVLERPALPQVPTQRRDERALGRTRAALAPRRVVQRGR